ncbi:enoyl-CoA hydratase/isomerase family protein [Pseudonocardia broussonetiae]|uniref:Enoyl-CoA hydratase/isomerase family protein n=1 Tax=Pseudonocardia broussonetiae TaxID=2736640 RepID=A0A6M6JU30_9PSEU|nr:enoyl-CoA hydratase/isomerase family protein [Pseudonocardia broussonetiae]QJY49939.1 enoyl-CoA hydratase/isomerase family protein [Pseudonocardia broussonetiae]
MAHAPALPTELTGDFEKDAALASEHFALLDEQLAALPPKPERTAEQQERADALLDDGRGVRARFLDRHVEAVYDALTDGGARLLRVAELAYAAADLVPGLVPTRERIAQERRHPQKHKDGWEYDQGILISRVLDHPRTGYHLLHAMAQPRREALDLLEEFRRTDRVDLGSCLLERRANVGHLTITYQKYLNAEDDESTAAMETATDLVLLDDRIEVGLLRGAVSEHPKYAGRRVFDTGVNLTRLYHGEVSLIEFFIERELGLITKWYRGHSLGSGAVSAVEERHEKPWIAAVDTFAIGGGCQYLLVMDRVVARSGAYVNLPARREGFLPGCGNMRLPRFVGERVARQGIFFNRDIYVDSPEGRMIVDDLVVDEEGVQAAIANAVEALTATGPVGVGANRTEMRVGVEPLEAFRHYMANLSILQARCMYSPAIIRNLEQAWDPARRGGVK